MASAFCLPAYLHAPCVGVNMGLCEALNNLSTLPLGTGSLLQAILLQPLELNWGQGSLLGIPLEKF